MSTRNISPSPPLHDTISLCYPCTNMCSCSLFHFGLVPRNAPPLVILLETINLSQSGTFFALPNWMHGFLFSRVIKALQGFFKLRHVIETPLKEEGLRNGLAVAESWYFFLTSFCEKRSSTGSAYFFPPSRFSKVSRRNDRRSGREEKDDKKWQSILLELFCKSTTRLFLTCVQHCLWCAVASNLSFVFRMFIPYIKGTFTLSFLQE